MRSNSVKRLIKDKDMSNVALNKSDLAREYDVIIIGAGPAGLAAALGARDAGAENILIIDREQHPGGILQQCIHPGFGLKIFRKELTGPEYAHAYIEMIRKAKILYLMDTFVYEMWEDRSLLVSNNQIGLVKLKARTIVLAMGCREGTRGSISIPGFRPAGIFTAGTAQRLINIDGLMVGKNIVILGSGDIGLIMARRCTIEGTRVKAMVELLPYPGGLNKNVVQCVHDFDIPLLLSHTVTFIDGLDRVKGVKVARVDRDGKVLKKTEKYIKCDTLLLSIGLIPENELSRSAGIPLDEATQGPCVDNLMQTEKEGFFAGGNVVQVYDLVDYVSEDSYIAGSSAARYARGKLNRPYREIRVEPGKSIKSIVPRKIRIQDLETLKYILSLRVAKPFKEVKLDLIADGKTIGTIKRPYAVPSEMIRLDISKYIDDISSIKNLRISLEEVS